MSNHPLLKLSRETLRHLSAMEEARVIGGQTIGLLNYYRVVTTGSEKCISHDSAQCPTIRPTPCPTLCVTQCQSVNPNDCPTLLPGC